ncbi:hypothetical protein PYW07_007378 [Mythimna separata]|uniref:Uncharacterized protein n=1 Tax=Mythimna separata TaxID=271217 RepID=A0AAD7Z1S5_MYTSE|nr:hypothetical protein PYW07_007378 [Mythimna separata]
MESEDESTPTKKRHMEIKSEDEDSPVKRKRVKEKRNSDDNNESSDSDKELPVKKIERQTEFSDILHDLDDLNEPACMDRILMYLEEIKDEDHFFMELLLSRLKDEQITWEQPWYQQSNSLSRPLKTTDIENHSEPYRTDSICKAECDKIQENWNEFMKLYDVPDKLVCLARWRNKDKSRLPNTPEERARRFVVAFLARGLQRTLFQVFRHVMTHFGGSVKGAYSAEEEKIMKVCFMHHPNNSVTLLSMVLGREPRGIYKRLQQLFNGKPEKKRITWNLESATRFLRLLLKYTQLPLEELKYRKIDKPVWLKLAKKFDQHYIHLQNFWYGTLHVQVFVKTNIKINKLRKRIFQSLKSSSYQVWTDIRWKELVKQYPDGLTHRFIYVICQRIVCKIPEYLKRPLWEVAEQALQKLKKHQYRKRRLKTLQYNENGYLDAVRYD